MLNSEQWETLEAMVNRIIPPDESPAGWDAGVGDYLARQFHADLTSQIGLYSVGLTALDQEAHAAEHVSFADTSPSAQDALLARIEAGEVRAAWPLDPRHFFRMVVGHAMEGFYADPGNGGNRDGISWRMIGFEVRG